NTLGGMSTWLLGWLLARRYPPEHLHLTNRQRAVARLKKWGSPLLLFSWLPFIGDPLCFAAGWLRINAGSALFFIGLGKTARYLFILFLV
ncbi:MAG: DedA family protein, partial [Gammaproteobacteria bacterium]|nr:DedA family protein [Gammaproteobacteria bacterium]